MTRTIPYIFFLTVALLGCSDISNPKKSSTNFTTFEMSCTNGWMDGFSIVVDSNKTYFFQGPIDTTYYGQLSEDLVGLINSTVSHIKQGNIQSIDTNCDDCPALAIKIVSDVDTTRIKQFGQLDTLLSPVIEALQNFKTQGTHKILQAQLMNETKWIVIPPHPDIPDPIIFTTE
jgi:hypothetical protein